MNIRKDTPSGSSEDNPVAVECSSVDSGGRRFREVVNSLYMADNMKNEERNEEGVGCVYHIFVSVQLLSTHLFNSQHYLWEELRCPFRAKFMTRKHLLTVVIVPYQIYQLEPTVFSRPS